MSDMTERHGKTAKDDEGESSFFDKFGTVDEMMQSFDRLYAKYTKKAQRLGELERMLREAGRAGVNDTDTKDTNAERVRAQDVGEKNAETHDATANDMGAKDINAEDVNANDMSAKENFTNAFDTNEKTAESAQVSGRGNAGAAIFENAPSPTESAAPIVCEQVGEELAMPMMSEPPINRGQSAKVLTRDEIIREYLVSVASRKRAPAVITDCGDFVCGADREAKTIREVSKIAENFFRTRGNS